MLLDWQSIFVNGQPVPYSKALARRLISHPALKRFLTQLVGEMRPQIEASLAKYSSVEMMQPR